MNFNTYTQKSIEAVQLSQSIARTRRNPQIEQLHLLSALLNQEGGLVPQLLKKSGMDSYVFSRPRENENCVIPEIFRSASCHLIAHRADGGNIPLPQLLAQGLDVHVHRAGLSRIVVAPHR